MTRVEVVVKERSHYLFPHDLMKQGACKFSPSGREAPHGKIGK